MNPQIYMDILRLYAQYSATVDSSIWEQWPDFFVDDSWYRLKPRENHEAGLPLCLLALESKAMMKDRVYDVKETMYHDPYYQRHVVSVPHIFSIDENGEIRAEANYIVFRTKRDGITEIFNAGFYSDHIIPTESGLKFKSRLAVYDTEMVSNSLIYPI